MAPVNTIGMQSIFKRSTDGTASNLAALARVKSINGINLDRDMVDATAMDSASWYEEVLPGIRRTGDVTVGLEFDADGTEYANALTDFASNARQLYEIEFPDGSAWQFNAYLRSLPIETPREDQMLVEFVYKVDGVPTFTAAT